MNFNKPFVIAFLGALLLLLAACGPTPVEDDTPAPQDTPVSPGDEIGGYTEFVDALRTAGATVQPTDQIEQPFFPVMGQVIVVNGWDVQVFEFDTVAEREQIAATISETGDTIGRSVPSWIDQPNFWAEGRLIVLFVGRDQELIDLLTDVLGEPITRPGPSAGAPPEAVLRGQERMAVALGVAPEQIEILEVEQMDWPDACLGLAEPDEACAEVITPGWRAAVEVNGQIYELRTDETGNAVRWRSSP
jgi:hypothetical protein